MNRDDIIKMAQKAYGDWYPNAVPPELERFAALVAAHEREACARICFQEAPSIDGQLIAEAIRARGEV